MTNALAQTTENIDNFSQILTQNVQNAKVANLSSNNDVSSFSNIINGLSAKNQELKTNIEKIDTKTNAEKPSMVSSINKEALNTKTPKKDKTSFNTSINNTGDGKKTISLTREKDSQKVVNNTVKENYNSKITNNSSFPKSSPVFSSKNETTTETSNEVSTTITMDETAEISNLNVQNKEIENTQKAIEKIENLCNILNTITQNSENVEQTNADLNVESNQADSLEFAIKTIEEVTNFLQENGNFLSDENKQMLLETLSQIQTKLESVNGSEINQTFESLIADVQTEISTKLNNSLETLEKLPKINEEFDLSIENLKQTIEKLSNLEISSENSNTPNVENEISETISKIQNTIDKLTSKTENAEENTLQIKEDSFVLKELNEVKDIVKEIETLLKDKIDIKTLDEKIIAPTEEVVADIKIPTEEKVEIQQSTLNSENVALLSEKTNTVDIEDLKDNISKIKDILKTENIDVDNKEINSNSNNKVVTLNNVSDEQNTDFAIEENNVVVQQNNEILSQMVQVLDKNELNEDEIEIILDENAIKEIMNTKKVETETIDTQSTQLTDNAELLDSIDNSNEIKLNDNKEIKVNSDASEEIDTTIDFENNFEFSEQDFSNNENLKETFNLNSNNENTIEKQDNQQKEIFTQSIKDEMLLDMDFEQTTHSSALSVSDEIAKLALEETNNLNVSSNFKGSVVYDSSLGNSTVIKNIPQNIKVGFQNVLDEAQNQTNNLMNQIGDKLQQLKDNSGQRLTMVLRPNDLGRLSIELTTNQNGLTTNLIAQNEDVRNYIEKNINTLRQQLSDAGINVNQIQIKTAGQDNSSTYSGNQNFDQGNFEQNNQNNSPQSQNNQNSSNSRHNKQDIERFLSSISNFDTQNNKDFSAILNKTLNYNLN